MRSAIEVLVALCSAAAAAGDRRVTGARAFGTESVKGLDPVEWIVAVWAAPEARAVGSIVGGLCVLMAW